MRMPMRMNRSYRCECKPEVSGVAGANASLNRDRSYRCECQCECECDCGDAKRQGCTLYPQTLYVYGGVGAERGAPPMAAQTAMKGFTGQWRRRPR
jgi:hypothetical protein